MENPDIAINRVIDALALAAEAHRHQRRKDADATPYINHPIALLRILSHEAGVSDPDVLCAALLHDYLEDCCGQDEGLSVQQGREILEQRFGPQVRAYVDAVTDDKTLPKPERKRLQVEHAAHARKVRAWSSLPTRFPTCATSMRHRQPPGRASVGRSTSIGPSRSSTRCAARIQDWKRCLTRPMRRGLDDQSGVTAVRPVCASWIERIKQGQEHQPA